LVLKTFLPNLVWRLGDFDIFVSGVEFYSWG